MLPCPTGPRLLPLLPLLALAGAVNLTGLCESEMNAVKDLLQVSCEGKGLSSVPQGLPPDTGLLLLASNCLARVSMASFQHLKNLTELDLSNNSLVALQTGAPLPCLQQLALSHNALERLPALEGLPGLVRLALGHNALSQLPEGAFRGLATLQELELQGNRLRRLPPGAFQGLAKLKDLDLSDNLLEELPGKLLAGLAGLEILRLERNQLRALPRGFFPRDLILIYAYLEGNPWLCDCQLEYLRDWIVENELSIYTRQPGETKEITENDPESVRCQAPPKEKGGPVMLFQ
ncbi:platelet glycoprotein Ib alpha chain, partial [Hemicordylus capensis]|uniref:platelet glycoprotein Ib alpha chain n=1 Tax=Hemicordylus capensis TaxID=884348 RepID=UPI0023030C8E